ncbi:MAG TPA: hypothetical protein VFA50_14065 [Stellaceae bacterium]|nr:hypothetical protein [Stellaceae bacterium]
MRGALAVFWILYASAAVSPVEARYLVDVVQFDAAGTKLEEFAWQCADDDVAWGRCAEGVLLVIDGAAQPVDLGLSGSGPTLRIRASWRGRDLAVAADRALEFDRRAALARRIEVWTRRDEGDPQGLLQYPVLRGLDRRLAAFGVLVERFKE